VASSEIAKGILRGGALLVIFFTEMRGGGKFVTYKLISKSQKNKHMGD
jgi:hypothetical protein